MLSISHLYKNVIKFIMTELKQKLKSATQNLEMSLLEKKVNRLLITRGLFISVILFFSFSLISFFLFKHSLLIAILEGFLWSITSSASWIIYGRLMLKLKIQQKKDFPMISLPELFSLKYDNWVIWVLCGGFGLGYLTFFFLLYMALLLTTPHCRTPLVG